MSTTIAIASGKGGVGKTTVTANLGIALGLAGKKVIMVDADLDMANLELVLGMEGRPITLQDVLTGEAEIQDAVYEVAQNARFVPAGVSPGKKRADPEKIARTILQLSSMAEYILLDCPAGIGKDTIACFAACKQTLLILTPEPMSASDAYKTKIAADRMGSELIGLCVNMAKGTQGELTDKEVSSLLEAPVLSKIPYDENLRAAALQGKPILLSNPTTPSAQAIAGLAARICGETYIPVQPRPSFFSKLFGFLKKR
ncbi:P-loop NTPase [Candidatus Micrarchaeota archaeon]|nr:P-loop NTPase [Candidatus Micrarchaeota archaeon]